MTIKYVATSGYLAVIERVEIDRETVACVWIKGVRHEKRSSLESFHDTFEAAKKYIAAEADQDLDKARARVYRCGTALTRIMNLKEGN